MEKDFEQGHLVWAKMKGYPPWPARILKAVEKMDGIPNGCCCYSVLFYGTGETAIMRKSDLYDYHTYREEYELQRKNELLYKGFSEALREARLAAGYTTNEMVVPKTPEEWRKVLPETHEQDQIVADGKFSLGTPSINGPPGPKGNGEKRCRRVSNRSESVENLFDNLIENPSVPTVPVVKRTPSRSPTKDLTETRSERRRLESWSSLTGRRKMNSFSQPFEFELSEDPMLAIVNDITFGSVAIDSEDSSKSPTKSIGSPTKFITGGHKSPVKVRDRINSSSSSGRTRLLSGMSDACDDLFSGFSLPDPDVLSIFDDHAVAGLDEENSSETPQQNVPQTVCCSSCGCHCVLYGVKWRCSNLSCLKWNGLYQPSCISSMNKTCMLDSMKDNAEDVKTDLITLSASSNAELRDNTFGTIRNPVVSNIPSCLSSAPDSFSSIFEQTSAPLIAKVEDEPGQLQGCPQFNTQQNAVPVVPSCSQDQSGSPSQQNTPLRRIGNGRPKYYKVEKTPQVAEDGCRHCFYCNGQVRPQMCGGNRHRWRCVDKKCRKWYGWVRSHEEIPKDLGKKGRWKDLIKIRRKSPSSSDADGEEGVRRPTRRSVRQSGSRPRSSGVMHMRSCMQRRVRWWTSEKRPSEPSPEREFRSDPRDAAAACLTVSKALLSVANMRIEEPVAVDGAMDLLMDTLFSSFAPILTQMKHVPGVLDQETEKMIWEACAPHTPKFG